MAGNKERGEGRKEGVGGSHFCSLFQMQMGSKSKNPEGSQPCFSGVEGQDSAVCGTSKGTPLIKGAYIVLVWGRKANANKRLEFMISRKASKLLKERSVRDTQGIGIRMGTQNSCHLFS